LDKRTGGVAINWVDKREWMGALFLGNSIPYSLRNVAYHENIYNGADSFSKPTHSLTFAQTQARDL